ncbi:MAG: STAS domain-containing protein [Pirellulaceae bacterium]|jgi:anti-sigma B factor antagonist|nr:STAS domain-containing protein [Pirellulaceae bacterium]
MAQSEHSEHPTKPLDDGFLVKVTGEIDLIRSPALRGELMSLLKSQPLRLVLDLSNVPLMDSSGVATLIEVLQIQRNGGRKLVLCGLQDKVRSVFEITRLQEVFHIVSDSQTAQQA